MAPPAPSAVDELPPLSRLLPLAAQHVLAMIAAPVSSVFLIAAGLRLPADRTASLLSATLILCGAGALLQSFGVLGTGARLPFMMLPGGAAVAVFLRIAREHGAATASGSVLLAAALLLAVLPLYARIVRFFPPLVMGATVLVIGVNMIDVAAPMGSAAAGSHCSPSPPPHSASCCCAACGTGRSRPPQEVARVSPSK